MFSNTKTLGFNIFKKFSNDSSFNPITSLAFVIVLNKHLDLNKSFTLIFDVLFLFITHFQTIASGTLSAWSWYMLFNSTKNFNIEFQNKNIKEIRVKKEYNETTNSNNESIKSEEIDEVEEVEEVEEGEGSEGSGRN